MQTDSKGSIVKTEPGSKPILDPNRASLRALRDRVAFLAVEKRKRLAGRAEINRQVALIDRESDGLTGAIMAATARLLDEVSP